MLTISGMMAISPANTIDRDAEQVEFHNMLSFTDSRRLLLISDRRGTGKSTLLRKFHWNCEGSPIYASLVQLDRREVADDYEVVSTPLEFARKVRRDVGLDFTRFDRSYQAYGQRRLPPDREIFSERLTVTGTVNAGGSDIQGGTQSGVVINEHQPRGEPLDWASKELERLAEDGCIADFFTDLHSIAMTHTIVILVDTFEAAARRLREDLIQRYLINKMCLAEDRPNRLLTVIAGLESEMPSFRPGLEHLYASRRLLGWKREHIHDFIRVYNLRVDEAALDALMTLVLVAKIPISQALRIAKELDQNYDI